MKAARFICRGWVKPANLPSNAEIRDEIQAMTRLHEGETSAQKLLDMRIEALRIMRILERFRPRLIGSVLTGHVRAGSDIDIHVFTDSVQALSLVLDDESVTYDTERKKVRKHHVETLYTHVHIRDRFPIELTVYPANKAHYVFKSSITGKPIERASIPELTQLLAHQYPELDLAAEIQDRSEQVDRFQVYQALLLPLENVKQHRKYHPEGDALYHSLQVFDLARDELPYDEEFQLAALLHDVGKAIDPRDHVEAGLQALNGYVTDRTAWFIQHHMEAHGILDGTIGARSHRRLRESEDYDELVLLCECDVAGRTPGVQVPDLDEALDEIRELARMCG
jgi:predicted HD phosphohydrolase